ncbi:MAG: hypothetical protein PHQ60_07265 [Sideroxydans sp.]|nr:hypothetical protein [Sideroxydans sp.]
MIKEQVMRAHLEQRTQVEDYVFGESLELPDVPEACRADCLLGSWLHSEGEKNCTDVCLLDSLCSSCEEFREAAAQVLLLAKMGELELAKNSLRQGEVFIDSSDEFLHNLVLWDRSCTGLRESRV